MDKSKKMEDYMDALSSEEAYSEAKIKGLVVVLPKPNELQVDLDSPEALVLFNKRLDTLYEWFDEVHVDVQPSRTEGCHHATVKVGKDKINPMDRIFLQLFLGSDPVREFLSFQRNLHGDSRPTLFFERRPDE